MSQPTVGILHPGSMGAAVAACATHNAADVLWCEEGRGPASRARAETSGLTPVAALPELLDRSDIVISLCPPAAAEDLAHAVAAHGFTGTYVEANAITATRAGRIADLLGATATVVDGGVIGPPPRDGVQARLYLSGPTEATRRVTGLFTGTSVQALALDGPVGRASALKLSYAGFQKVSRVLVGLSYGLAREHGVDEELRAVAAWRADTYLAAPEYVTTAAARAWRWGPEMEEVAEMLADAGLPANMLHAAAAALARWDDAKDDAGLTLDHVLDRLARP